MKNKEKGGESRRVRGLMSNNERHYFGSCKSLWKRKGNYEKNKKRPDHGTLENFRIRRGER